MKRAFLPLLLICFQASIAQEHTDILTPEELREDADYYFRTLYTNHPDPYYYCPLREFEDIKNKIYSQLEKPMTKEQFLWIICEINSCVDWHSIIHLHFHFPENWRNDLVHEKINLFPAVKIKKSKLFLADNIKEDIIEINGIQVSEILSNCHKYYNWTLPHEPNNWMIESWLTLLFHYKYKFKTPYKVKFSNSNKIKTINSVSLDEFLKSNFGWFVNVRGAQKDNLDSLTMFSYKIYPAGSIGIFYMNTFDESYQDEFNNTLKKFTEEVNTLNIKYIFYDLSKNYGGNHLGCNALDIVKHDTVYYKRTEIERRDAFNKKTDINEILLLPNFDSNIPSDRKLFVFQSLATRSNGDYFCRIVAENNLGVLIGENTGEPTVAFSICYFYSMPNSKIEFKIATKLIDFSGYFDSETLNPDIYWDIHHNREFTEKELDDIIEYYKKHVQVK